MLHLSPTLFKYINHVITEWKGKGVKGIKTSSNKDIKTLLFVDDRVAVADSEDAVQISVHKRQTFTSKYGLKNQQTKQKTPTFVARVPVRSETVMNNNILEHKQLQLPSCSASSQNEKEYYCYNIRIFQDNGNY